MMYRLWLFLIVIVGCYSCGSPLFSTFINSESANNAIGGVLDLQNRSFADLIKLDGQWRFYPGRHIVSQQEDQNRPVVVNIQVPRWWDDTISEYFETGSRGQGYGSYQLAVLLPDRMVDKELAFYLNHFLGSYRLFIDDGNDIRRFYGSGDPSPDKNKNIDNCWEIAVCRFVPKSNKIILTVEAANYTYGSGGFHTAPIVGTAAIIDRALLKHKSICYFVIGTLFVCLLFNFSSFALHKDDNQIFWIMLLCGATLLNFLHRVFPNVLPDQMETRIFMLSFHTLFLAYLMYYYGTTVKKVAPDGTKTGILLNLVPTALKYAVLAFAFCMLFLPSTYTIFFIERFRAVPLLMIVYMVFSCVWLILQGRRISKQIRIESMIHVVSIAGLTLAGLTSVFFHENKRFGADSNAFLAQMFGGISLVLSQTFTVLYRSSVLRRQAESDRLELKKLVRENFSLESTIQRKTDFIAMMNHEIRTPLNHIIGFTELLYEDLSKSRFKKHIQKISVQSKWLIQLVNSLIDVARMDSEKARISRRWVPVSDFFSEITDFFSHQLELKGLFLNILPSSLSNGEFQIDDTRLRQVVINVVSNAIKFTDRGGITIATEKIGIGRGLIIKISDTGIGIDARDNDAVFKPFDRGSRYSMTQKTDGFGFGLTIAERLLNEMEGAISFESTAGVGTTFKISLPDVWFRRTAENAWDINGERLTIEEKPSHNDPIAPANRDFHLVLQEKREQCDRLMERKVFKEIDLFASEIKALGSTYSNNDIIDIGNQLMANVETFDVDGINKNLRDFLTLCEISVQAEN